MERPRALFDDRTPPWVWSDGAPCTPSPNRTVELPDLRFSLQFWQQDVFVVVTEPPPRDAVDHWAHEDGL
eukprot:286143-Lingulodinium_polyedra.AAC.1